MPDGGWIPLWRKAFSCHLSPRKRRLPYTEFEAWLDLLCRAVQSPKGVTVKGVGQAPVKLFPGEVLFSYRGLQDDWRWGSHNKVRRYCASLCRMGMIEISDQQPTRLKIVNAERYGLVRTSKRDGGGPATDQRRTSDGPIQQEEQVLNHEEQRQTRTPSAGEGGKGRSAAGRYTDEFEDFWKAYPKRRNNPKPGAFRKWTTLVKAGAKPDDLIAAAGHYAQYVTGKGTDQEHVKMAQTFLGPSGAWEEWVEKPDPADQPGRVKPGFQNRTESEHDEKLDWE